MHTGKCASIKGSNIGQRVVITSANHEGYLPKVHVYISRGVTTKPHNVKVYSFKMLPTEQDGESLSNETVLVCDPKFRMKNRYTESHIL